MMGTRPIEAWDARQEEVPVDSEGLITGQASHGALEAGDLRLVSEHQGDRRRGLVASHVVHGDAQPVGRRRLAVIDRRRRKGGWAEAHLGRQVGIVREGQVRLHRFDVTALRRTVGSLEEDVVDLAGAIVRGNHGGGIDPGRQDLVDPRRGDAQGRRVGIGSQLFERTGEDRHLVARHIELDVVGTGRPPRGDRRLKNIVDGRRAPRVREGHAGCPANGSERNRGTGIPCRRHQRQVQRALVEPGALTRDVDVQGWTEHRID